MLSRPIFFSSVISKFFVGLNPIKSSGPKKKRETTLQTHWLYHREDKRNLVAKPLINMLKWLIDVEENRALSRGVLF